MKFATHLRRISGSIRLSSVRAPLAFVMAISIEHAKLSAEEKQAGRTTVETADRAPAPAAHEVNPDPSGWSEPLGNLKTKQQGLQFRLSAPRTLFEAWEMPTLVMEVRNASNEALTEKMIDKVFQSKSNPDGLRFLFQDAHRRPVTNPNRWLVPEMRMDLTKLVGLKPGESSSQTVTMAAMREQSTPLWDPIELAAGRYTIGLGSLAVDRTVGLKVELKTNSVTLQMLPPGVKNRAQLDQFLHAYEIEGKSLKAGFVPNGTTLVWGEPVYVTFLVENPGDVPFSFGFGGDYRGSGRHDRFKIEIIDVDGLVEDPVKNNFHMGGISMWRTAGPHDCAAETVEVAKYRALPGPGKYHVKCAFTLTPAENQADKAKFNVPVETTFELTILPPENPHVDQALTKLFGQCEKTGGLALLKLTDTICSLGQELAVPGFATMAATGDVEHRLAAAKGLGAITAPAAMQALLRLIRDPAPEVRAAAITSLGSYTDQQAVDAEIESLSDPSEQIRHAAAGALGKIKTDAAIEALIERLPKADLATSAAILRGMGISKSPKVFDIITQALKHQHAPVRLAALDAILNFPAQQAAEILRQFAATDDNMDFREAVIRKLAETLKQPIDAQWLVPVIKSRKGTNTIGDAPRLMRLYCGERAVPAILSCLDFENPEVRSYYNLTVVESQLSCRGALAIPWHADLNRDGTAAETEENRRTLKALKSWVDHCQKQPIPGDALAGQPIQHEEQGVWGAGADDLSIRARMGRSVWPAGLPQVISLDAQSASGRGSIHFSSRPEVLEVEVNSEWYSLPKETDLSVCGEWNAYHGNARHDLQLDGRWRRKSDGQTLDLKPGTYTVRIAVSLTPEERRTGLATSEPVKFEVMAIE